MSWGTGRLGLLCTRSPVALPSWIICPTKLGTGAGAGPGGQPQWACARPWVHPQQGKNKQAHYTRLSTGSRLGVQCSMAPRTFAFCLDGGHDSRRAHAGAPLEAHPCHLGHLLFPSVASPGGSCTWLLMPCPEPPETSPAASRGSGPQHVQVCAPVLSNASNKRTHT